MAQRKALEAHTLIPKPLSDNLWGEINNYAYERHLEDQRKQKEDDAKRREEIKESLSKQVQEKQQRRKEFKEYNEKMD